jgi:uncharacterized protein YjbI with pentapeptide repeats
MKAITYSHDELSKKIQTMMIFMLGYGFFCLLLLITPDEVLLQKATLSVPLLPVSVSINDFFTGMPILLLLMTFHLHMYIGQWLDASPSDPEMPLPYSFNINTLYATVVTHLLFYWLPPLLLLGLVYKASVLAERVYPIVTFFVVSMALLCIFINRKTAIFNHKKMRLLCCLLFMLVVTLCVFYGRTDGSKIRYWQLNNADLSHLQLRGFDFKNANLVKANLTGADVEGVDFEGANLSKATLDGADFERANLCGAELFRASAIDANFNYSHLCQSSFLQSRLNHATFVGASLLGANFQQTDLSNANLQIASLQDVDFFEAQLLNADLRGADIRGAIFGNIYDAAGENPQTIFGAITDKRTVYCETTELGALKPDQIEITLIPCDVEDVVLYMNNNR